MVSLTAGIPQSDANPMLGWFDQSDEIEAKRAVAMEKWRRESVDAIDRAALDPGSFFAEKPLPFPDEAVDMLGGRDFLRNRQVVSSYLTLANDGRPIPSDPVAQEVFRDQIALQRFNGRGAGSDEAFLAEIRTEAQGRKDATLLMQDVSRSAATAALMSTAGETVKDYAAWIAEARSRPGYRRELEPEYLAAWQEQQRALSEEMAPVRELIAGQWAAMKEGKTFHLEGLSDLLANDDARETFLCAIGGLVKALPKEQQPSIMANLRKQFIGRDAPNILGGLQRSLKPFDRDEPLPDDYLSQIEPGMDLEAARKRLRQEFERDTRRRDRFMRQLESIVNDEYDPIVTRAKEGTAWAAFEKGLYAAPGVALTVGVASIPGAGQHAMFEVLRKGSTDQARDSLVRGGMDQDRADEVAETIGTASAAIQLPMEFLGLKGLTGKLPFLNRAVDKLTTNLAGRYIARAAGSTAVEFTTEMGQDLVPGVVQDFAAAASQDIPDTQWTGEGGVFQDYDKQSLETLGAIIPFSLIMAGGGVFQDRRIRAFAETPDIVKRAAGLSEEAIAAVNAAEGIGAQERAIAAAWETRDMGSETAQAAQAELTGQVQAGQSAAVAASDNGIIPRAVRSADGGWTLYDTVTGEEVGRAPNEIGAARLAAAHAGFTAENDADRIASVVTAYQAAEASGQWSQQVGRSTETNLDLGREMTAAEFAGESQRARQRASAQERLMGGDVSLTSQVFGVSRTEFAEGQLRTVNRILGGGSVLDVFHEETHGFRRAAREAGTITRDDDIAILRAVDTVLAGTDREGRRLALLPENFDTMSETEQDVAIDEGVSQLMEAEVLRTRKGGGKRPLPAGVVSKNLSALARILGDRRLGRFRSFINAFREFFGLAIDRAAAVQRGLADGTLDRTSYESYLSKLYGIDEQLAYEQMARDAEAEILDGLATPDELAAGDPFSLGPERRPAITNTQFHERHLVPRAGESPESEGSREEAGRRGVGEVLAGREGSAWQVYRGDGQESTVWSFDEGRILKEIRRAGVNRYTKAGGYSFDYSFEAVAEKAAVINALGGMPTSALETSDGRLFIIQDEGTPITESEYQATTLPFGIEPARGGVFRAEIDGKHYLISDLHRQNFMKDAAGVVRLTDAVVGEVTAQTSPLPEVNDSSLSLGSRRLGVLTGDSIRRIKNPLRRAQAMERVSRKLEEIRLDAERLELLAGSRRIRKSLAKEAAVRQALRREELENEAWARHAAVLTDDDLTKLKSQPGHAFLSDPASPLKGRLLSRTAAAKKHPDLFAHNASPAEYDGSENVSRTLFGGDLAPDLAAQEMFEAGLIREPSTDAMWQMLEAESKHVASMKKVLEAAKADLREARTQAKADTNAWLAEQTQGQAELTVEVTKQSILERLAALDAILSSVPPEVRGRVGGYMQAARITSPEAGLEFLRDRLAKVDDAMEQWLRRQYDIEFRALLDRARPEKDEAGQKPRGKIGSDVHELFASIRDAMTLTADETEALAVSLESLAMGEDTTAAQASHLTLEANLVRLAGNWGKADAARREAALLEATRTYEAGYMAHRIETTRKRERRAFARDRLQTATGKAGTRAELQAREQRDQGTKSGRAVAIGDNFRSFEQIVQQAFGLDAADATMLVDWERRADAAKTDALHHKQDLIEQLFTDLAGGRFKGEQLHERLSRKGAIQVAGESFSELEAITATLMWRQADGQRHMRGHVNDQGKPSGDWNYDDAFMTELEDALSAEAKAVRLHLIEQYAAEYDRLNPVFRQLYGLNMPRHKHYSPLTVAPVNVAAGQMQDPVSQFGLSPVSLTPGSLRKRSETAVAQPLFRDALEVYLAHSKQMEHWMAYAPFATEAMAILNNRDIGNAIEAAAGREALTTLRSWLDYFAQGGTRDAAAHLGFNRLWNRIASRFASMALVGRVSVLAIQSTQLGAAWSQMPTGAYLSRFARLLSGRLGWKAALQSEYIQRRLKQQPAIVQQAMEGLRAGKPTRLKFLVRQMGRSIAGADALFTAGTFAIVHDYQLAQAKARGMSGPEAEAWALNEAERATDRIAQPVRPGARSLVEITGTNPAMRILWSFASDARQKLALSLLGHSDRSTAEKIRAYAVTWLVGGVVATVIRSAMRDIRDDGEDEEIFDERNWDLGRLTLSAALGPLQGIALIGDTIEGAMFAAMGEYLPSGTMLDTAATATKAAKNLPKWFSGDREIDDAIKDAEAMLTGAGMVWEGAAAATSLIHVARDLSGVAQNFAEN